MESKHSFMFLLLGALGKELTYGMELYVQDLKIQYIPNCSHWVQQEKPQLVNQYIGEFFGK